jgi:hypothetical protein
LFDVAVKVLGVFIEDEPAKLMHLFYICQCHFSNHRRDTNRKSSSRPDFCDVKWIKA